MWVARTVPSGLAWAEVSPKSIDGHGAEGQNLPVGTFCRDAKCHLPRYTYCIFDWMAIYVLLDITLERKVEEIMKTLGLVVLCIVPVCSFAQVPEAAGDGTHPDQSQATV